MIAKFREGHQKRLLLLNSDPLMGEKVSKGVKASTLMKLPTYDLYSGKEEICK